MDLASFKGLRSSSLNVLKKRLGNHLPGTSKTEMAALDGRRKRWRMENGGTLSLPPSEIFSDLY